LLDATGASVEDFVGPLDAETPASAGRRNPFR
jgi:hypothetical protein